MMGGVSMRIGIGQMNSQNDKQANLTQAEDLIDRLAGDGAQLIMLPEYFNYIGAEETMPANAEPMDGPSVDRLRRKAIRHGVYIHSGSFLEAADESIFNTAIIVNPNGDLIAKYRKIHLFDVEIPGGKVYKESNTFTPGNETVTVKIGDLTFGLGTCYDLRFPELFRRLIQQGAQVILVSAAFTLQTGRDHWELLLRARAVENLCWVCAAGQFGSAPPHHQFFGRSMIVDPWGVVVAQASDGATPLSGEIDTAKLERIRTRFPALNHRREDLFSH